MKIKTNRKLWIAVLIIATVLLAADVIFCLKSGLLTGGQQTQAAFSEGQMPSFGDGEMPSTENGEMPSFESGDMPSTGDGEMPSFGDGQMPSENDGQRSDAGEDQSASDRNAEESAAEASQETSGSDSQETTTGHGQGRMSMPEGMTLPQSGFGTGIKILALVIFLACLAADILSIIMLVRIKKGKADASEGEDGSAEEENKAPVREDPVLVRKRKRKRQIAVWSVVLALVLVVIIVLEVLSTEVKQASGAAIEEKVITETADSGSLSETLTGSGVLASASEEDVTVPGTIKVTAYQVAKGDTVQEGDIIATVDRSSVLAAISDIEDLMAELDAEATELTDDALSSTITASYAGRVVKIYAEAGEDVIDVMYDKGSLMLISLDGLLSFEVDNQGDLNVGDTVTVSNADGQTGEGTVAAIEKEKITITVSLDDFAYGDQVTAKNGKTELGSGELDIYSRQSVTGYSGKVSAVNVTEGQSVSEGTTLLTLTDTDYEADHQTLTRRREKLVDQYNRLVEISRTGYVCAEEDGVIAEIDESLLTDTTGSETSETVSAKSSYAGNTVLYKTISVERLMEAEETESKEEGESSESSESSEESTPEESVEKISYTVKLLWLTSEGKTMSEGMPETVTLTLSAGGEVVKEAVASADNNWTAVFEDLDKTSGGEEISYEIGLKDTLTGYAVTTNQTDNVMTIVLMKEASSEPTPTAEPSAAPTATPSEAPVPTQGPTQPTVTPSEEEGGGSRQDQDPTGGGGFPSQGGSGQGMSGGMSGSFGFDMSALSSSGLLVTEGATIEDVTTEAANTYTYAETTICTMTPNDTVSIDVSIDELDIGKIVIGNTVSVTLDAFPGQTFEGKITALDPFGTNSGGNTKYTVTVSMDKQENMLLGMNASVGITLGDYDNVLLIPEAALSEEDGKVYVYTAYDEKKDELSGQTEVTCGVSDGSYVQILSGLSEGDTIYYRYAGSITYTFKNETKNDSSEE